MQVVALIKECPMCHSKDLLMEGMMRPLIDRGSIASDLVPNVASKTVANIDARKPPITGARIAAARVFYDICTKCGWEFPYRQESGHLVPSIIAGAAPTFE